MTTSAKSFEEMYQIVKKIQRTQEDILARLDHIESGQQDVKAQQEALTAKLERTNKDCECKYQHLLFTKYNPAGMRMIETFELLEKILLELSMFDLLRTQRVSKRFLEVIEGSVALQRTLFFTSEPAPGKQSVNPLWTDPLFIANASLSIDYDRDGELVFMNDQMKKSDNHSHLEVTTAALQKNAHGRLLLDLRLRGERWTGSMEYGCTCRCKVHSSECQSCSTHTLKPGSWSRMYLCQPSVPIEWDGNFSGRLTEKKVRKVKKFGELLPSLL